VWGISLTTVLILGGLLVLRVFVWWEQRMATKGAAPLVDLTMLRNPRLVGGLTMFFFQFLLQAGLFFTIPLFLSIALGLSAVETGVRLLPLSVALLVAAIGIPKRWPRASPRRVVMIGNSLLLAGIVSLIAGLDLGAGEEVVTVPLLLAGLGVGALASQLGAVTVSAEPDERSGEVGGLQNTATNLGASLGTALAGSILITGLTASFLAGLQDNPDVPDQVASSAQVELVGGIPFVSDADLDQALEDAGVPVDQASAIVDENASARISGLRLSLTALALLAALSLFFIRMIPTRPVTGEPGEGPAAAVTETLGPPAEAS
jgi:Na+/melibiose symporter-like transporter